MEDVKEETMTTDSQQVAEGADNKEAAPSSTNEPSVEDMAAHDYRSLIPIFYKHVDFMSKKKLLNLLKALVEYPLERNHPKLSFEEERKAFYFGMQIFDCKFILMKAVMEMAKDKGKFDQLQAELAKQIQGGEGKV